MLDFKVFHHESIDSTSLEAKRLLEGGQCPPFLVSATQQTAGRGRTGRTWDSPKGNLYLSLVLDSSSLRPEQNGVVPLHVAYLAASWIQYKWNLRTTIKWPNDLLFAGRKLAGILCETVSDGSGLGPVIIGFGLNVASAPNVDQETTSICQWRSLGSGNSVEELSLALGAYLKNGIEREFSLHDLDSFLIESGQLWTDGRQYMQVESLDHDGNLILVGQGKTLSLNHSHHDFKWLYQKNHPVIVADAGNTSLKIGLSCDDSPMELHYLDYDKGPDEAFKARLKAFANGTPIPIHLGAVAEAKLSQVKTILEGLGFKSNLVPKRPLKINFERYRFSDLGIDRLALAEAAAFKGSPGKAKMALSLGTASTVEAIDGNDNYLGGWILPGLQTGLDALHQKTSLLPKVQAYGENDWQGKVLGHNTRTAMKHGSVWALVFAVQGLMQSLKLEGFGDRWDIMVTGGEGERAAELLGAKYHETLILEGLRLLVTGGR